MFTVMRTRDEGGATLRGEGDTLSAGGALAGAARPSSAGEVQERDPVPMIADLREASTGVRLEDSVFVPGERLLSAHCGASAACKVIGPRGQSNNSVAISTSTTQMITGTHANSRIAKKSALPSLR
jgi:hypothetical protein